jgi:Mrp family chromosome partitioning ATPase
MGHQIIKCPDGTLAVFSSVTDTWVMFSASPQELEDHYAQKAADDARENTRRIVGHVLADEPVKVYYQFAMSFSEANAISIEHGGEDLRGIAGTVKTDSGDDDDG